MKTTSLLIGTFLILLTGGCMSDTYGPASPDYYPNNSPPFTLNSKPGLPAHGKVTTARSVPPASLPALASETPPAGRS